MPRKPTSSTVKKVRKVRGKGRPSVEGAVGRQKLIDATRELLRTIPPARLTSNDIARAAGGDRALVRYYFGTMANLFSVVASELSAGLVSSLSTAAKVDNNATDKLRHRIQEFVRYELENPALHPLYTEQLLSDQSAAARKLVRRIASEGHLTFEAIIKEGRRSGEFRKDFDIRLLDIAIVGLCEFIVVGQPILEAWLSPGERVSDLLTHYADFVADLVVNGIRS
ncbi:MAG: TetR family transcriptional regulator [Xanthobacteraceae bacterium]|nr:TetR family transcriptional regulator [Xanthobacteraceae bacterium]